MDTEQTKKGSPQPQHKVDAKIEAQHLATYGMFLDHRSATVAVHALKKNGFSEKDISLIAPQKNGQRDFVYQQRTSIREGSIIGATLGFFILGFVGFLIGLNVVSETQTGFVDSRGFPTWLLTSLIGAAIGIVVGAASGALVGIGTPRSAAKRYGFYLKEGGIMLTVSLHSEADRLRANHILEKTGAQDISILDESNTWSTVVPEKQKLSFNT